MQFTNPRQVTKNHRNEEQQSWWVKVMVLFDQTNCRIINCSFDSFSTMPMGIEPLCHTPYNNTIDTTFLKTLLTNRDF